MDVKLSTLKSILNNHPRGRHTDCPHVDTNYMTLLDYHPACTSYVNVFCMLISVIIAASVTRLLHLDFCIIINLRHEAPFKKSEMAADTDQECKSELIICERCNLLERVKIQSWLKNFWALYSLQLASSSVSRAAKWHYAPDWNLTSPQSRRTKGVRRESGRLSLAELPADNTEHQTGTKEAGRYSMELIYYSGIRLWGQESQNIFISYSANQK